MGPVWRQQAEDWPAEMEKLVGSHPTLAWLKPASPGAPHVAVWDDDEGSHREPREDLRDLVQYLQAKFRARA